MKYLKHFLRSTLILFRFYWTCLFIGKNYYITHSFIKVFTFGMLIFFFEVADAGRECYTKGTYVIVSDALMTHNKKHLTATRVK